MKTLNLTPEVRQLEPSATLAINERSKQLQAEGREIIRFGLGQSPFPVPESVVEILRENADIKDYLNVRGLWELREQVAAYHSQKIGSLIQPDQVLIGPGSKQLMFNLQLVLSSDVILPAPVWVSYAPQAKLLGRGIEYIQCKIENDWKLEPEALQEACSKKDLRGSILLLNYPCNPTGHTYTKAELEALAEVCRENELLVLADEIYGELAFSGEYVSMAEFYPEGTVISAGLSKWCGAGGWRVGTFVIPKELPELRYALAVIASESYTSVNAPSQFAAIAAFEQSPEIQSYLTDSRRVLETVASHMVQNFRRLNVKLCDCLGGFYVFVDFEHYREPLAAKGISNAGKIAAKMLDDVGVAFLPGVAFGRDEAELSARLAFVDFDGGLALENIRKGQAPEEFLRESCPWIVRGMQLIDEWLNGL